MRADFRAMEFQIRCLQVMHGHDGLWAMRARGGMVPGGGVGCGGPQRSECIQSSFQVGVEGRSGEWGIEGGKGDDRQRARETRAGGKSDDLLVDLEGGDGNLGGLHPCAARVPVEVAAGLVGAVHCLEIEAPGRDGCFGSGPSRLGRCPKSCSVVARAPMSWGSAEKG
jgi:hypothetical protein